MEKKKTFANVALTALFPTLLIPTDSLLKKWEIRNNSAYRKPAAFFLLFFTAVYIAHYHFVDLPAHKEPRELYFNYRYGLATLALICGALTHFKITERPFLLRIPLIIAGMNFGYWQAKSMTWRPDIPYLYAVLFPLFTGLFLKLSPFTTLVFVTTAFAIQFNSWNQHPEQLRFIVSACIAGTMTLLAIRSRIQDDIHFFLLEEENFRNQKKLIETQMELNEQIKTFLPSELFRRFTDYTRTHRLSPLQAVDEILRPKERFISVLSTDIRGYTVEVKRDLKKYSLEEFIPQQKLYTDAIDRFRGVPRVVGDQIFAYFDHDNPVDSVVSSVRSAALILEKEGDARLNGGRPIIISSGNGIVGNVGGTISARVISVIGSVANLPSRIDPLTKIPFLKNELKSMTILLTKNTHEVVKAGFPNLVTRKVDIPEQIAIRDFPEETSVFLLDLTPDAIKILKGLFDQAAAIRAIEAVSSAAADQPSFDVAPQLKVA